MSESETFGIPKPFKALAITSADLRSPCDAETQAVLADFVPAHAHFGELTYLKALRELLEERGMALTYSARKAALEARQRARP